jgi:hypothetical protein
MTNEQLEFFAKDVSNSYVENNEDMNHSICKLAEEHALNRHEIDRIVEKANVNTHLTLFGNLPDRYVEFPVADSEKVATMLNDFGDLSSDNDDYQNPPEYESEYKEVSIFPKEDAEKTSSDNNVFTQEDINFRTRVNYANKMLESQILEKDAQLSEEFENLYNLIKQDVLGGTSFGQIKQAAEQHFPEKLTSIIFSRAKEKLAEETRYLNLNLEDSERLDKIANIEHPILEKISSIVNILIEVDSLFEKQAGVWRGVREIGKSVGVLAKNVGELAAGNRKRLQNTLLLGGGLTVGAVGGRNIGKQQSDYENSVLKKARGMK